MDEWARCGILVGGRPVFPVPAVVGEVSPGMSEPSRVLVVDDDVAIRMVIADALDPAGYAVRTAQDGADALAVLEGWRPGVIVLDLMMPGVDGFAFREEQLAREDLRDIPVVVVSAVRGLDERTRALRPAATVAKPFDLDALIQTVARVVSAG